jgi:CSLREA domain-containing protein
MKRHLTPWRSIVARRAQQFAYIVGVLLMLTMPRSATAATFLVNEVADNVDTNPGDGLCTVSFTGYCSLRAAVQEANAHAGQDVILVPAGSYVLSRAGADENAAATGDLDLTDDVIIIGAGIDRTIILGGFLDRVFDVWNGASIEMHLMTVRDGETSTDGGPGSNGGGLRLSTGTSAHLVDVKLWDNIASTGAGFAAYGPITLERCEVAYNFAIGPVGSSTVGGGAYAESPITIIGSSFHHNYATFGAGVCVSGGIFGGNGAVLQVARSTISDNISEGVRMVNAESYFTSATIYDNDDHGITVIDCCGVGQATLTCTAVAGHTMADCWLEGGFIDAIGWNLSQDGSCGANPSDLVGDPMLGRLVDSPGRTPAHAPLPGSPLVDNGSNTLCTPTDQWGRSRPVDLDRNGVATANIGALEDLMLFGDGFEAGFPWSWSAWFGVPR